MLNHPKDVPPQQGDTPAVSRRRENALARAAAGGDRQAMEQLLRNHYAWVFNLALRMLWNREDAEDACQEVMLRLAIDLPSFRGESAFRTWAWRVAVNHLRRCRASRAEKAISGFECYGRALDATPNEECGDDACQGQEEELLLAEVKIGCMTGMLLCLDREQRLVFLLGAVFGVSGREGAAALGLTPANFRQKLTRSRQQLASFMADKCGLMNPANPCRCVRKTRGFIAAGIVDPGCLQFAVPYRLKIEQVAPERTRQLDDLLQCCQDLFRAQPFQEPLDAAARINRCLEESPLPTLLDLHER